MSSELLRRAAKEMRERANRSSRGQWSVERKRAVPGGKYRFVVAVPWRNLETGQEGSDDVAVIQGDAAGFRFPTAQAEADAEYIASWHPAVALAVADWLDAEAAAWPIAEKLGEVPEATVRVVFSTLDAAVAVARTYLGEEAP